jgi:hypothetical protein
LVSGPTDVTEIVAVPAPAAAKVKLAGETAHVGGCAVAGVTEHVSATVPANPPFDVPVSVHVLVDVVFATGVTDNVDGLAANVKLPVVPPPTPPPLPDADAMKFATSTDPSPVASS